MNYETKGKYTVYRIRYNLKYRGNTGTGLPRGTQAYLALLLLFYFVVVDFDNSTWNSTSICFLVLTFATESFVNQQMLCNRQYVSTKCQASPRYHGYSFSSRGLFHFRTVSVLKTCFGRKNILYQPKLCSIFSCAGSLNVPE